MKIVHITTIEAALSIMRSRQYRPASGDPLNGDAGLNAFDMSRPGNFNQHFGGRGARLLFDWTGPVDTKMHGPFPPNMLQDQMPWRVFIPVSTTKYLTLVGFEATAEAWDSYPFEMSWYHWTASARRRALLRAKVRLHAEIDKILETKPDVQIGSP